MIKAHSKFQQASIIHFPPLLQQYIVKDQVVFSCNSKFSKGEVDTNIHIAAKKKPLQDHKDVGRFLKTFPTL